MALLEKLKKKMRQERLDGLFVSKPANVSYLSGFTGDDSYVLLTQKNNFFITDFRYKQQAKLEAKNFNIKIINMARHFEFIAGIIEKKRLKRVGFEARHISYAEAGKIRDFLKKTEFAPTYGLVEDIRIIKSPAEIELIKEAVRINKAVMKQAENMIEPGVEEKDLAALMEYVGKSLGSEGAPFKTIVLYGKRSAMPHGSPGGQRLKNNGFAMVDHGTCFEGYNSDLTRMFFLGKIPSVIKKIYKIVMTAQQKAIKAAKSGVKASFVDSIARDYIKKRGWANFFGHSLGHGIGREVHEAPSISIGSKDILSPGMVFTIEPAIYVPGIGGVRLEEMVLVTKKGCEVL